MVSGFEHPSNSRSNLASSSNNESKLGFEESMKNETNSNNNNNEGGDFECNICFELAQDPIVTLCGHLFCWPCLYKWLRFHSQSQECPVCKALIQEDKLVPLYGRGKSSSDPRSRPVSGQEIPNRPSGQRPETAPPPQGGPAQEQNYFSNLGVGLLGGFMPMASARFGNITMSAGFGGLLPSLFSFQFNGFPHNTMYGAAHGFPYAYGSGYGHGHGHGYGHGSHGFHHHHHHHHRGASQGQDNFLKNLMLVIAVFVLAALVWS